MEQLDAQMKQLAEKDTQLEEQQVQLAQKDTVISSAVSAIVASGKTAAEIAALLNIPLDVVRKITEN